MEENLYQIISPYYTAGFISKNGKVINAAPIIGWVVGKDCKYCLDYFQRKGFKILRLN